MENFGKSMITIWITKLCNDHDLGQRTAERSRKSTLHRSKQPDIAPANIGLLPLSGAGCQGELLSGWLVRCGEIVMSKASLGFCGECKAHVPAEYVIRDNWVWFRKSCPDCGVTEAPISSDAATWLAKRDLWDGDPARTRPTVRSTATSARTTINRPPCF